RTPCRWSRGGRAPGGTGPALSIGASVAATTAGDAFCAGFFGRDIHHAPPARPATSATAMIAMGFLSSILVRRWLWRAWRLHALLGRLLEGIRQLDQARLAARGAREAHAIRRGRELESVRIRRRRRAGAAR